MLLIDPPEGWRYGFPKRIPKAIYRKRHLIKQWLIDKGYPKDLMDSYKDHFYYRIITKE
jgi:hypothetical protein